MKGGRGVIPRIVAGALLSLLLILGGGGLATEASSPPIEGACTSFCLDEGGHALLATNYDNQIWEGLLFVNKRGVTKTGWEPAARVDTPVGRPAMAASPLIWPRNRGLWRADGARPRPPGLTVHPQSGDRFPQKTRR